MLRSSVVDNDHVEVETPKNMGTRTSMDAAEDEEENDSDENMADRKPHFADAQHQNLSTKQDEFCTPCHAIPAAVSASDSDNSGKHPPKMGAASLSTSVFIQAHDAPLVEEQRKRSIEEYFDAGKQHSWGSGDKEQTNLLISSKMAKKRLRYNSCEGDLSPVIDTTDPLEDTSDLETDAPFWHLEPGTTTTQEQINLVPEVTHKKDLGQCFKFVAPWALTPVQQDLRGPSPVTEDPATVTTSTGASVGIQETGEEILEGVEHEVVHDMTPLPTRDCMPIIPALSKRYMFQGCPAYRFAVRGSASDDIIYEFQVVTGPSWIENAGNGAFLTFLGARQLKLGAEENFEGRPQYLNPVQGLVRDSLISLKLKGVGLDTNLSGGGATGSKDGPSAASRSSQSGGKGFARPQDHACKSSSLIMGTLSEASLFSSNYVRGTVGDPNCHEEDEDEKEPKENSPNERKLTALPPLATEDNAVVECHQLHLGLVHDFSLDDYEANDDIAFSSTELGCIDLGVYGPFLRSDRKNQSLTDIKNFIWNGLPSSYLFEFDETLDVVRKRKKVADITDDLTGTPHKIARSNIAMYINETGGTKELKQTVWANDLGDDGIHYLFHTQEIGEMKKGDTIELLISYSASYDDVRHRLGYGLKSDIKSDAHFPTYLERQFVERFNMTEEILNEMVDVDLYALSELLLKINNGLSEIIDAFLGDIHEQRSTLKLPCHHVLVALRRIHWLKPILQHKAEALERKWDNDTHLLKVLNHCAENIKLFGRKDWPEMFDLFDVLSTGDDNVKQLRDALRREATEEICYKIHPFLTLPCDEDAYCGVAVDLISDLALAAAKYEWSWGGPKPIDSLFETFMNIASKASIEVREPSDMSKLTFPRTCFKRYQLENRAVLMDQPDGTRCILTYYGGKGSDVEDPEPVVVDDATFWDPKIKDNLHSDFYLSRQVIFVVDAFAKRYLGDLPSYSLEVLCKHCGICVKKAWRYLQNKIHVGKGDFHPFFGRTEYQQYIKGNGIKNPRSSAAGSSIPFTLSDARALPGQGKKKRSVNKIVFWQIVWVRLQEFGWTMDRGNRPGDWYLCPPGVIRGQGARPRRDFFDSIPLVLQCLESDERYCFQPETKKLVRLFQECEKELQRLKSEYVDKKFASVDDLVSHLVRVAENNMKVTVRGKDGIDSDETVKCDKVVMVSGDSLDNSSHAPVKHGVASDDEINDGSSSETSRPISPPSDDSASSDMQLIGSGRRTV